MKQTIFWAYSLWFGMGGLAMALLSGCVSLAIAFDIATNGYILVNGQPSRDPASIAGAVGIPLIGVAVGWLYSTLCRRCDGKAGLHDRPIGVHSLQQRQR